MLLLCLCLYPAESERRAVVVVGGRRCLDVFLRSRYMAVLEIVEDWDLLLVLIAVASREQPVLYCSIEYAELRALQWLGTYHEVRCYCRPA